MLSALLRFSHTWQGLHAQTQAPKETLLFFESLTGAYRSLSTLALAGAHTLHRNVALRRPM